jgi:small subunit ribosomal protein S3
VIFLIERKFVASNIKEYMIQEFIAQNIKGAEHSHTKLQRIPLGEKIIIYSSRPGIIVGKRGQNIKQLTKVLKKKFDLENPQIEIAEVDNIYEDSQIMAERIANYLEKFGIAKFKSIGHKVMTDVINSGAMGIEIIMSGKIPSARAKSWRFYQGYLKKCGDVALTGVRTSHTTAELKSGTVGIKVSIMPHQTKLPDDIMLKEDMPQKEAAETKAEEKKEEKKGEKAEKPKRKGRKKAEKKGEKKGAEEKPEEKKE